LQLYVLESASRQVVAVGSETQKVTCEVTDFLSNQPKERSGAAKGYRQLFLRYAQLGRQGLTSELFHEVDKKNKIWEFLKGGLRVFCFVDNDDKLIILTHGIVKKTQKVSKKELQRAIGIKEKYLASKRAGTIKLERIRKDEY